MLSPKKNSPKMISKAILIFTLLYTVSAFEFLFGKFPIERLVDNEESNVDMALISPLAIGYGYGMFLAGAKGTTETNIRNNLFDEQKKISIIRQISQITNECKADQNMQLYSKIVVVPDCRIKFGYKYCIKSLFGTTVDSSTFDEEFKTKYNEEAKDATNQRIKELIGRVDTDAKLALLSGLSYKSDWQDELNIYNLGEGIFTNGNGQTTSVDYIGGVNNLGVNEGDDFKVARLPMKDGMSMYIVLPESHSNIGETLNKLTPEDINHNLKDFPEKIISLKLPKLDMNLKTEPFPVYGSEILPPVGNDFTGICDQNPDRMRHYEEVSIKAVAGKQAKGSTPISSTNFHAERPFAFFVSNDNNNAVIIAGYIKNY